jgi:hypothetical protein
MTLFKKRVPMEDFVRSLITEGIPKGLAFYDKENAQARKKLSISDADLAEFGAGMMLFFLTERIANDKKAGQDMAQRATRAMRRALAQLGANADHGQDWWKAISDDALIMHGQGDPLDIACQAVWNRLFRDRPYAEHGPIRSYGYFLQIEVDAAKDLRLT